MIGKKQKYSFGCVYTLAGIICIGGGTLFGAVYQRYDLGLYMGSETDRYITEEFNKGIGKYMTTSEKALDGAWKGGIAGIVLFVLVLIGLRAGRKDVEKRTGEKGDITEQWDRK